MIEISNLTKRYGNHLAVDNLNLTVEKGKIYGFLGPNGAGKSTTMNIITGYIGATEGTVIVNGFDMFKEPEKAKQCIGYLPEIPPLYMDMTVIEYLKFVADIKKLERDKKEEYIEEAIELARIEGVRDRLIKNLSKGYRQRVGLAQAVLGFPEVIILDEPTVGLDPKQIIEIRDVIKKLGEKHTVILSSHILSEVREICDYIFIISKGKLVASDTTENIEKMAGGERLVISVKGDAQSFSDILANISGVDIYEVEQDGENAKAIVTPEENTDIREQLFYALAENKMPIVLMNMVSDSLEEIFIKLTSDAEIIDSLDRSEGEENGSADEKELEDNFEDVEEDTKEYIEEDTEENIEKETEEEVAEDDSDL